MITKIALLLLHSLSVADAYSANLALRRPLSPLRALPARAARARPPATMLLPGVLAPVAPTAAAGYKVALTVGGAAVALHVGLVQLINRLPEKRRPAILAAPGYAVYKLIALAFCAAFVAVGFNWYVLEWSGVAAAELILVPDATVRWLAAAVFGSMVFWDLPCAIFIKRLRGFDNIAHHVGMALAAWLAMTVLPLRYAFFFLGAQELSSLPIILYDLYRNAAEKAEEAGAAVAERLAAARDTIQLVAAASFVAVRGVEFSRMVFLRYLPDIWVTLPGAGTYKPVLRVATALILIYEALQLFWLYNIGIAMVDRARGGDGAPPAAVSQR